MSNTDRSNNEQYHERTTTGGRYCYKEKTKNIMTKKGT